MTTPDLSDLISRVEAATGADRELDGRLLAVFDPSLEVRKLSVWRGEMCCGSVADCLPPFTATLDAALALVERLGLDPMNTLHEALETLGARGWSTVAPMTPQIAIAVLITALEERRGHVE